MASIRWIGLVLGVVAVCAALHGLQNAESQDVPPQPPEVIASNWAGQNIGQALQYLLPIIHPDPSSNSQEFIGFRYTHWILVASREYSFSFVTVPGAGPHFHWAALVRMPMQGTYLAAVRRSPLTQSQWNPLRLRAADTNKNVALRRSYLSGNRGSGR